MNAPDAEREGFADLSFLVSAFQVSKMIQVAVALGIADSLHDGPKPATKLVADSGADASMVLRLCRALSAFGIFEVDSEDVVRQSARSAWLRKDARPTLHHAALYWMSPGSWSAWANLEHGVRTGACPFEDLFGQPYFSHLKQHPEEAALLHRHMQHSPDNLHAAVVEACDFSGVRLVVDVGGGNGALLKAILTANAHAEGLLYDQEAVVAAAPELLAEPGLTGRCRVEAGDFFANVPSGGDCYTLSQILHDWNDERCLTILGNCRSAMRGGDRLLVIERLLESEPGKTNPMNFLADMLMMVLFPGAKERTPAEYAHLLDQTGFRDPEVIRTRSPFCVIETFAM